MFLIVPLHCFYLLLFGFLLSTTTVLLTTSTAHTCTYTTVRYCSMTELFWHLYWMKDEGLTEDVADSLNDVFLNHKA